MHLSRNESWVLLLDFLPKFRVAYLAVFRQHYCEVILIIFFSIGLIGLSDSFNENQTRWQGRHEETFPPPPPRAFIFGSPVLKFMCQSRTVFLQNNARVGSLKCLTCFFAVVSWDWLERPRCSTSVSRESHKRTKKTCPWNCTKFWPGNLKFWV